MCFFTSSTCDSDDTTTIMPWYSGGGGGGGGGGGDGGGGGRGGGQQQTVQHIIKVLIEQPAIEKKVVKKFVNVAKPTFQSKSAQATVHGPTNVVHKVKKVIHHKSVPKYHYINYPVYKPVVRHYPYYVEPPPVKYMFYEPDGFSHSAINQNSLAMASRHFRSRISMPTWNAHMRTKGFGGGYNYGPFGKMHGPSRRW